MVQLSLCTATRRSVSHPALLLLLHALQRAADDAFLYIPLYFAGMFCAIQ